MTEEFSLNRRVLWTFIALLMLVAAQAAFAMPGGEPLNDDPFASPGSVGGCPLMLIFDCVNGHARNCYLDQIVNNGDGTVTCRYRCEYVQCQTA